MQVAEGSEQAPAAEGAPAEGVGALQGRLEEEVGGEDPFSGEVVVRLLGLPFVLPEEREEEASWSI